MSKSLFIVRGVSGSGKTTVAQMLSEGCFPHYEADMYFYDSDGNYNWKQQDLSKAHKWCQANVETMLSLSLPKVIVSNTFTTEKEMQPYIELAEKYGYTVFSLVVEHRHSGGSLHEVPEEILEKQETRLRGSLKLK